MEKANFMSKLTKEKMARLDDTLARFKQEEKQLNGFWDRPPVDVIKLATELGFAVFPLKMKKEIEGFILSDDQPTVGSYKKIVVFNSGLADNEPHVRFIISHEICHYISDRMNRRSTDKMNYISMRSSHREETARKESEQEIDYLAAALLMPSDSFKAAYSELKSENLPLQSIINELSKQFVVEDSAVINRLDELDLV